jgi:3-methyladenine DNA glycosylase AlkD
MPLPDEQSRVKDILDWMEEMRCDANLEGMARFGIRTDKTFGISMEPLKAKAKEIGKDHEMALALWKTGYRDARLMAVFIDDFKKVTPEQMESWVMDFDSWDVCDGVCLHLFARTPHACAKVKEWARREEEYQRRAGFVLLATVAVKQKKLPDGQLREFLPLIEEYATDERNFVKKAVNWALRQIGKRNVELNAEAIATAERIMAIDSKAARWIAKDALRELKSEAVQERLRNKR